MRAVRGSLIGVASALVLLVCASASANRLSVNTQTFTMDFTAINFEASGIEVSCRVILEASLHSATLAKTRGLLVGQVVSGVSFPEECEGTEGAEPGELDETLPWHITYNSFTGTLPNITGIAFDVVGASFSVTVLGVSCLFRSTTESPLRIVANVRSGAIATADIDDTFAILKSSGSVFCPRSGTPDGTALVETLTESEAGVIVRLI